MVSDILILKSYEIIVWILCNTIQLFFYWEKIEINTFIILQLFFGCWSHMFCSIVALVVLLYCPAMVKTKIKVGVAILTQILIQILFFVVFKNTKPHKVFKYVSSVSFLNQLYSMYVEKKFPLFFLFYILLTNFRSKLNIFHVFSIVINILLIVIYFILTVIALKTTGKRKNQKNKGVGHFDNRRNIGLKSQFKNQLKGNF